MSDTVEKIQLNQDRQPPAAASSTGCMQSGLLYFMTAWILVLTAVAQTIIWVMEQDLLGRPAGSLDFRWLALLTYGLAVMVPALLILAFAKNVTNRRYHLAFFLAGLFALLTAPARLAGITNAFGTALLLLLGTLLFLVVYALFFGRPVRAQESGQGWALALLCAGLFGLPWLLWGALGSAMDTFSTLVIALLFGWAASRVLRVIFAPGAGGNLEGGDRQRSVLAEGFIAFLALLVMTTGLGANGSQGLITLSMPMLGWGLAALYRRWKPEGGALRDNVLALALLVGLSAFWPLAFFDPDELAAVPTFGLTELVVWSTLASFVGLAVGLVISLLLFFLRGWLPRFRAGIAFALVLLVWAGAAALYLGVGQPGLHGDGLFVIMKEQADLSGPAAMEEYDQRRAAVYSTLVQQADSTQAGIRADLDRWGIQYQPYYLQNAIEVKGGPLLRLWLEQRPEVERVLDNPRLRPLPAAVEASEGFESAPIDTPWNLKLIGADRVWSELEVTGQGILVGQSDSGVQGDHPELADSYLGAGGDNNYAWFDPWNHSASPVDIGGHGTHTLGSVLGNQVGVAPDAQWIGCVNLARNLGNPASYLDCMQFNFAPFPQGGDPLRNGRPERGAHVLNNSWGCPPAEGCDPTALLPATAALRAAGVFVVASAGNEGDGTCSTLADPIALYDPVYSVGAVDRARNLAFFSSVGPVEVDGSMRMKPDISAPGVDVLSAYPGSTYSSASGTSMAGPHVAGVVALMWSANPALIGDIELTEQILNETAAPYTGPLPECVPDGLPNNAVGYGIVDAYEAVRAALEVER